jgi:hypothetical protein
VASGKLAMRTMAVRGFYRDFQSHLIQQLGGRHELVLCLEHLETAWKVETGVPLSDLERLYEALTFLNAGATTSIPLSLPKGFPARSRELELLEWELKKYVQQRCLSPAFKRTGRRPDLI